MPAPNPPNLEVRSVWTGSRPVRAAWLIPPTATFDDLRALMRRTCLTWGGWFYLFVPVDQGNTIRQPFRRLLRAYDPDIVSGVGFEPEESLRDEVLRQCSPLASNVRQLPAGGLWATPVAALSWAPGRFRLIDTSYAPDGTVQLIVDALFGAYSEELYDGLVARCPNLAGKAALDEMRAEGETDEPDDISQALRQIRERIARQSQADQRLRDYGFLGDLTPMDVSLHGLQFSFDQRHYVPGRALTAVVGASAADFCLFHALTRLRVNAVWFPWDSVPPEGDETAAGFLQWAADASASMSGAVVERTITFCSASLGADSVKELGAALFQRLGNISYDIGFNVGCEVDQELLNVDVPKLHVRGTLDYSTVQFLDGKSTTHLPLHIPSVADPENPNAVHWFQDVSVSDYWLPAREGLIKRVLDIPWVSDMRARIGTDGVLTFSPVSPIAGAGEHPLSSVYKTRVTLLDSGELFRLVLERAGYGAARSDKGRFQDEVIERLGGIAACWELASNPHMFRVLNLAVDGSRNTKGVHDRGTWLSASEPRYLDLPAICRAALGKRPGELDPNEFEYIAKWLDKLVAQGVFTRGLLLKCPHCLNMDWHSLGELDASFACQRCRRRTPIGRDAFSLANAPIIEPHWSYRLDEIFYQWWKNHGWVPVLAVRQLHQERPAGLWFGPEMRVQQLGANKAFEVDLLCCLAGDLFLGEAKSADELDDGDVQKYVGLARRLRRSGLVFATARAAWKPGSLGRIKAARETCGKVGIPVRSLTNLSPDPVGLPSNGAAGLGGPLAAAPTPPSG